MSGILTVATSSLMAFQRALDVTGNNIANIDTKGYSRQTIQFASNPGQRIGNHSVGNGVRVRDIIRNIDQFATKQVRDTFTDKTQYETFFSESIQLDKLLSQEGTSVSASLQSFFNAMTKLNDKPDIFGSRGVMITQSELMVNQFNSMQKRLDEYQVSNNGQMQEAVTQINELAKNLAEINGKLANGSNIPELLDERDELLKQLSQFTEVSVVNDGNNSINVAIGNGEMLVSGTQYNQIGLRFGQSGQFDPQITLKSSGGEVDITANMHTGMLGGFLDFDKNILAPASQLLGQMAMGLSFSFNAQHRLGVDMNNQIGKDFFTDFNSQFYQLNRSTPNIGNTGTGVLAVSISDMAGIQASDYEIQVTDTGTNQVQVTRKSDGKVTTLNWTQTPPAPPAGQVVIDGMTINVDNIANLSLQDKFTVSPTRGAARDLALQIRDPREIAFASAVRVGKTASNTGGGEIKLGGVFNTTNVSKDYRIDFISDTQFNIVNLTDSTTTGPLAYTPNADNTIMIPDSISPSYSVVISGIPKSGDSFTSSYNIGGQGDNGNGLKLVGLHDSRIFEGGSETLFDRYSNLIADVGGKTHLAQLRADAADVLYEQATAVQQSKSGVNLDEEASNLMKYQQAYQAAGQLVMVANQMMNTLFDMMR